jgi:kynurenine formamidase
LCGTRLTSVALAALRGTGKSTSKNKSKGGAEWRAEFDATVTFSNGGDLRARGFKLDLPRRALSDADLGDLLVRHLGLLMVDRVVIDNRRDVEEAHKGSRGVVEAGAAVAGGERSLVDLSHPISDGMVTYPGLPGPVIDEHLTREASRERYAPGTEFSIGRISMVANTGTYLDAPFHRFADGADLAELPLGRSADLEGVLVRVAGSNRRGVDREVLLPFDIRGRAVLIHTGWDRHFGTDEYAKDAPFLTGDGATWLAEQGAALVGIDSVNIDDTADMSRPAHTTLLEAGIPIVEHLRGLDRLPPTGFRFTAAPAPVRGMGTWPVRAFAIVG